LPISPGYLGFSLSATYNRLVDRISVLTDSNLRKLHAEVLRHLEAAKHWRGYDYGHGYLYQSSPSLGFSGRRDTARRISSMSLLEYTRSKSVLDIGCNSGFISIALAQTATHVTGLDFNPNLINIATACAAYLELINTRFIYCPFRDFPDRERFDVVMSLSNHITFDGPVLPTVDGYIDRCARFLKPDGVLSFESHTPVFEAREHSMNELAHRLDRRFKRQSVDNSSTGTKLDRDRLLFVGRPR
jgi:SAM-dependent methyltransferase